MIAGLPAARMILTAYATDLRTALDDAGMSLRALTAVCGVPTPTLSRICTGKHCPTEDEAAAIGAVFPAPEAVGSGSARFTDPDQSHTTVRSIGRDGWMPARILELAREAFPNAVDATHMADLINERWPRRHPYQRNVVLKAMIRLEEAGRLAKAGRVRHPERGPGTVPTNHYVWVKEEE